MKPWKRVKYKKFNDGKDPNVMVQDNTVVDRPDIPVPIERTYEGRKFLELEPNERLNVTTGRTVSGRPLEQGLINVYPEFDIMTGGFYGRNFAKSKFRKALDSPIKIKRAPTGTTRNSIKSAMTNTGYKLPLEILRDVDDAIYSRLDNYALRKGKSLLKNSSAKDLYANIYATYRDARILPNATFDAIDFAVDKDIQK